MLKLSISSIGMYMECPASYYFKYLKKLPSKTDYPRLCGVAVHAFIAKIEKPTKKERRYFYKTFFSARKAWFKIWHDTVEENIKKMANTNKKDTENYGGIGWICIQNYWNQNYDKPHPLAREKRLRMHYKAGVDLIGVVDQIRTIAPEWVPIIRPDLVENGILNPNFDPVVIVDFKTGRYDYEISEKINQNDILRHQADLQRSPQVAVYELLYKARYNGKLPLGFYLYQLRNGKLFFVRGDSKESQDILFDNIEHVLENTELQSFPKNIGSHCRTCDYVESCIGNTNFYISNPNEIPDSVLVKKREEEKRPKQMRFNFKTARK